MFQRHPGDTHPESPTSDFKGTKPDQVSRRFYDDIDVPTQRDLDIDRDEGQLCYCIPVEKCVAANDLVKEMKRNGFLSCTASTSEEEEVASFKSLFEDARRSVFYLNGEPWMDECKQSDSGDSEDLQFDKFKSFLEKKLNSDKSLLNKLSLYKQDLGAFAATGLFASILMSSYKLFPGKGHRLVIRIDVDKDGLYITSKIENAAYTKSLNPEVGAELIPMTGYLKTVLRLSETSTGQTCFVPDIYTNSPDFVALCVGKLLNKEFIQVLDHHLYMRRKVSDFGNEIFREVAQDSKSKAEESTSRIKDAFFGRVLKCQDRIQRIETDGLLHITNTGFQSVLEECEHDLNEKRRGYLSKYVTLFSPKSLRESFAGQLTQSQSEQVGAVKKLSILGAPH